MAIENVVDYETFVEWVESAPKDPEVKAPAKPWVDDEWPF